MGKYFMKLQIFYETDLRIFKVGDWLGMTGFSLILIFIPWLFSCLLKQKETLVQFGLVKG